MEFDQRRAPLSVANRRLLGIYKHAENDRTSPAGFAFNVKRPAVFLYVKCRCVSSHPNLTQRARAMAPRMPVGARDLDGLPADRYCRITLRLPPRWKPPNQITSTIGRERD
jgi:hypothetical protein